MFRSYTELSKLKTFEERYQYLKLSGIVGEETFGRDRFLNQALYQCPEWISARREVVIRDNGCNLGVPGHEILDTILIHHMNPVTIEDVLNRSPHVFDPEYLICTNLITHNGIHYGKESVIQVNPIDRKPNDTSPWKK